MVHSEWFVDSWIEGKYLLLLFMASITENLNLGVRCFRIGGLRQQLRPIRHCLESVQCCYLWFLCLVMKSIGKSFVLVLNVKVHES